MKKKTPKVGRPRVPESERSAAVNTTIPAPVRAFLERVGDGSASRGLRTLAVYAHAHGIEPK